MSSFIQIPIEQKVGKGNRILRPLKRDPMIEVSAYRDNQFKVWRHHNVILTKYYVIITGNDVILGNTPGTRSPASHYVHPLHWEFEFLHDRRADYRIIWKMWRFEKSCYGTGQSQTSKFSGFNGLGRHESGLMTQPPKIWSYRSGPLMNAMIFMVETKYDCNLHNKGD